MVKGYLMAELRGKVEGLVPVRLDKYIAEVLEALTRSQLKARLECAIVNGKPVKLSRLVSAGDSFALTLKDVEDSSFVPEDIPLDVLYENKEVIVVNKAQGMVTHPAQGNWHGTLANALLGRLRAQAEAGSHAPLRAGIVHRLDKDTSGVIIAAKTVEAQEFLSAQFRERSSQKRYLAIVQGQPPQNQGHVDDWLTRDPKNRKLFIAAPEPGIGKRAWSDYKILATVQGFSLLLLKPRTGRTHQLRVHCKRLGCPILGDPLYGKPNQRLAGISLMLHARELQILLPGTTETRSFCADLPPHFVIMLGQLGFVLPAAL